MNRTETRVLVERVAQCRDPQAALLLYEHSIAAGHKRIALLRYMDARDLSVPMLQRHHAYACAVANALSDEEIEAIARQALKRSRDRHARCTVE